MFIILLIMKLVWSVVISKSFIMSIKSEEDLSNNPSELINNNNNKTNIYTGCTLQQVKTAVINVYPVPYALMSLP